MEARKRRSIGCTVLLVCFVANTFAASKVKRQIPAQAGSPWFAGELERTVQMLNRAFQYQAAPATGGGGLNAFPSAMSQMGMMGAEIEPTQAPEVEAAEGMMMSNMMRNAAMGNPGANNIFAQNGPAQNFPIPTPNFPQRNSVFSNNNAFPNMPMAGPVGEIEMTQAPEFEPAEGQMMLNPGPTNQVQMNSPWGRSNSLSQFPQSQPNMVQLFGAAIKQLQSNQQYPQNSVFSQNMPSAQSGNNVGPYADPQMNSNQPPPVSPLEVPAMRNPLAPAPRDPMIVPPPSQVFPSAVETVTSNPLDYPPMAAPSGLATNVDAAPMVGWHRQAFSPQAGPPMAQAPMPSNLELQPTGTLQAAPAGIAQPPAAAFGNFYPSNPLPPGTEIEPTQAPEVEPTEMLEAPAAQPNVVVNQLPYDPMVVPMGAPVDQTGTGYQAQNQMNQPDLRGYVF